MTTRSPRMQRAPLRIGLFTRLRLERLARRDSAAGIRSADTASGAFPDVDTSERVTPTVQAIQAHANAYARREEQRFFARMHRELTEYSVLMRSLDADLAAYDDRRDALDAPQRDRVAVGEGPAFEEVRRLERRIAREHRRTDELSAVIQSRFTAAKLRASRYYDRSDEKIAIYWGAFRSGTAGPPLQRPPALDRAGWLTSPDHRTVLELWRRRTDVQA